MGILGKPPVFPVPGPHALIVWEKDAGEAGGQRRGDRAQGLFLSRTGRAFNLESVSIIMVIPFERLDQQVVGRKPHGPAPIGIAPEEIIV
jgi:hypothetical protein